MKKRHYKFSLPVLTIHLLTLVLLSACAGYRGPDRLQGELTAYKASPESSRASRFAPLIVVEESQFAYNRPGSPLLARSPEGEITAAVDPGQPAIYYQETEFHGTYGSYRNLIYRLHFPEVPPGYLISGKNVGLLIVVTLDDQDRPLLYTTVHTCGCYCAIIPTSHLPGRAFPGHWNPAPQEIYGEILPGLLRFPTTGPPLRPVITLRSGTHRVMDVRLSTDESRQEHSLPLVPMATLRHLPLGQTTASFFEDEGGRKGYVRDSYKKWEKAFIGWWALDLEVGVDKDLGPAEETGTTFYTSLKPWARKQSDLWRFQEFLTYWGWNL